MKAAVVYSPHQPPVHEDFADPIQRDGHVEVTVLAAGLHPLVRSLVDGDHYRSSGRFPRVPGVDGIGRLPDGSRVLIGYAPEPYGTMSERTLVPVGPAIGIPERIDDVTAAAFVNPALGGWMPLVTRADLRAGQTVLVLGATGVAGMLAVQFARHLGAGRVIAAGRDTRSLTRLADLGADAVVRLDQSRDDVASGIADAAGPAGIDVVLDFVWGQPAEAALAAVSRTGISHTAGSTRFIQIGERAGATLTLPAGVLRGSGVEIIGSGAGSIAPERFMAEIPTVLSLLANGVVSIDVEAVPLADVTDAWTRSTPGRRLVFVP